MHTALGMVLSGRVCRAPVLYMVRPEQMVTILTAAGRVRVRSAPSFPVVCLWASYFSLELQFSPLKMGIMTLGLLIEQGVTFCGMCLELGWYVVHCHCWEP